MFGTDVCCRQKIPQFDRSIRSRAEERDRTRFTEARDQTPFVGREMKSRQLIRWFSARPAPRQA